MEAKFAGECPHLTWRHHHPEPIFLLTVCRIRLLLRAPVLSHPTLGASSTPIVARSVARILNTYATISNSTLFHPCYAQLRRIVTCGQLLVLCHTARELSRSEAEELFAMFLALLREHMGAFDFMPDLIARFESVGVFLGESVVVCERGRLGCGVVTSPEVLHHIVPSFGPQLTPYCRPCDLARVPPAAQHGDPRHSAHVRLLAPLVV